MEKTIEMSIPSGIENFLPEEALPSLPPELAARRAEAKLYFEKNGIPDIRHEDWKYSNIQRILGNYTFPPSPSLSYRLPEILPEWENMLEIMPLSEALVEEKALLEKHLTRLSNAAEDSFAALNTSGFSDGIFIRVKSGAEVPAPLFIRNPIGFASFRIFIYLEQGASLHINMDAETQSSVPTCSNRVTEIFLEKEAKLLFSRIYNEPEEHASINFTGAELSENSKLSLFTLCTGGAFVRQNYRVELSGSNANVSLNGLNVLDKKQHTDSLINIVHHEPSCESSQSFRNIVAGESTSVFSGKIYVAQKAQKTNAYQSNKNIVLSDEANAYSKPRLEIYADDVKCSHGSTTGQMDEEALFYLRTRGISEAKAKKLLLFAFAQDFIQPLPDTEFKTRMIGLIDRKLLNR